MKSAVVIAIVVLYSSMVSGDTLQDHAKKIMEKIMDYGATCAEKLGVSPEDIALLMKREIPESKAAQCVVACVHKSFKLQKEDGTINKGTIPPNMEELKSIDEDMYKKMTSVWTHCSETVADSADECDTGLNLMKCMMAEGEKAGLTKEAMGF